VKATFLLLTLKITSLFILFIVILAKSKTVTC